MIQSDILVIGGGVAGLSFALKAAQLGKVNIILKDDFDQSSSYLAQGGINAVMGDDDSFDAHIQDTIDCGYGLCHQDIVSMIVNEAPDCIEELIQTGVEFTRNSGKLSLHREGGHQFNRVVHAKDATGAAIMKALVEAAKGNENIEIFTNKMAIDLIIEHPIGAKYIRPDSHCRGAYVLDTQTNSVDVYAAKATYLATGGIGKVYPYTSNPKTATGDGIVMAFRAGIRICNMEFIQFHPTILFHPSLNSFLITEAVRGEGGILRDQSGNPFMETYHPELKDLAPRDIVARAIDSEIKKTGHECVYLDITHLSREKIFHHFPNIYEKLMSIGIDISKDYIPVVPAAHYLCGGLKVDHWGQTSCQGLFAGGECSFTGFHGANRLASNSLLEAVVYAKRSVEKIVNQWSGFTEPDIKNIAVWNYHNYSDSDEESLVHPLWRELRQFMWTYVGIVRTNKRLKRAFDRIQFLRKEIEQSYWNFKISKDLVELRNISVIAELIIKSAILRRESRGLHFNADHPELDPHYLEDSIMERQRHGFF